MPSTLGCRSRGLRMGFWPKRCARSFIVSPLRMWRIGPSRRRLATEQTGLRKTLIILEESTAAEKGLTARIFWNQCELHVIRAKTYRKKPWMQGADRGAGIPLRQSAQTFLEDFPPFRGSFQPQTGFSRAYDVLSCIELTMLPDRV